MVITPLLPAVDATYTLYAPQVADGGTWKTIFTIVNLNDRNQGTGTLQFHTDDGNPLLLPIAGQPGPVSQLTISLPPNGVQIIETLGTAGATTVGWAELNDFSVPSALGLTTLFRRRSDSLDYEASVLGLPVAAKSIVFSFDHTAGFTTGIAFINASSIFTGSIVITLRDDTGRFLQSETIPMNLLTHTAFSLTDRYPATRGVRGTIQLSPDSFDKLWLSAMAFRFNPLGAFTTVAPLVK
jgi:hypothetical protein